MTSSAYLTPVLLVGIVSFLSNMIFKEHPWIIILIIQVIIGMAVPIWLIVRHGPLQIHARRTAEDTIRRLKEWFASCISNGRMHGSTTPLEEQPQIEIVRVYRNVLFPHQQRAFVFISPPPF